MLSSTDIDQLTVEEKTSILETYESGKLLTYEAQFAASDSSGEGKVSEEEFKEALERAGLSNAEIELILADLNDSDGEYEFK